MFDFEKLHVYNKSKIFNQEIKSLIGQASLDSNTRNQLRRAAYSIMLNIAEGSGRFTRADKRNFYVIARGSVYESAAILDYLKDDNAIDLRLFDKLYCLAEELSKMLYAMIQQNTKQ